MAILHNDWAPRLSEEFQKPYYLKLRQFLRQEYRQHTIYPDKYDIFNALHYTCYRDTRVVILGQDPYPGPHQAHRLCFSVNPGIPIPPSLMNIYRELSSDLGITPPDHGCLIPWARQGVLLLNTTLTVRAGQAASHRKQGWELFTDRIIQLLNEHERSLVFLLWGRHAQDKAAFITRSHHLILRAPHPSPLSAGRGFFGSRPFSQSNDYLASQGRSPVNWQLPPLLELQQSSPGNPAVRKTGL